MHRALRRVTVRYCQYSAVTLSRLTRQLTTLVLATTALSAFAIALSSCSESGDDYQAKQSVDVYSGRHYNTDRKFYDRFSEETGIRVNLLESSGDALLARVKGEADASPADLLIAADAGRLTNAVQLFDPPLLQPYNSALIDREVPPYLRHPERLWTSFSRRIRAIIVNPEKLNPATVGTYQDLANPAFKGLLCLRNRKSVYNQSLVAWQLERLGSESTAAWVAGMVGNLAQPVFANDVQTVRAAANGSCGVAVVNHYYLARMLAGEMGSRDQELAEQVVLVWPDPAQENVTGGGITRAADNPEGATRLLEFLVSTDYLGGFHAGTHEYPLKGRGDDPILQAWGPFRGAGVAMSALGERNKEATQLMKREGWK